MSAKAMARVFAIALLVCAVPTTTWSQGLHRDRTAQIAALVEERPGTAIGVALLGMGALLGPRLLAPWMKPRPLMQTRCSTSRRS